MEQHASHGHVEDLQRGQHACLVYDGRTEDALALAAPFAAGAFAAGERCLYVVGEQDPARVRRSLAAAGVDVAHQEARGALVLVERWEVSFPDGAFDPAAMIAYVREAIAQALQDGFGGVRVVAEMTWALQLGVGANKLIHYEALGNHLYPGEPLVALCLYDRARFPAAVCLDALRVHPWVAVGATAYDNLYYEPPEAVIEGAAAEARVGWMLQQLERVRAAEAQRAELAAARAARERAEAEAQGKDGLLSLLAHELRTPLTSLLMFAQAALRRLDRGGEADLPALRRSLELMARQATKQARLIEQVLDAARLASHQLPLKPEPTDLAALAEDVAELTRAVAPGHAFDVRSYGDARARVDPLRFEQVLVNLLDNARKYSPDGTRVTVDLRGGARHVEVRVRDEGPGIPVAEREHVFERFIRLHQDRRGAGLGLHISREILRMHGGELALEPSPQGGACFLARVPRGAPAAAAGPEAEPELELDEARALVVV